MFDSFQPWDRDPKRFRTAKICVGWALLLSLRTEKGNSRLDLNTSLDFLYHLTRVVNVDNVDTKTWPEAVSKLDQRWFLDLLHGATEWRKLQRLNWLWQIEQVGTVPRSRDKVYTSYATEQVHAQSLAASLWRRGMQRHSMTLHARRYVALIPPFKLLLWHVSFLDSFPFYCCILLLFDVFKTWGTNNESVAYLAIGCSVLNVVWVSEYFENRKLDCEHGNFLELPSGILSQGIKWQGARLNCFWLETTSRKSGLWIDGNRSNRSCNHQADFFHHMPSHCRSACQNSSKDENLDKPFVAAEQRTILSQRSYKTLFLTCPCHPSVNKNSCGLRFEDVPKRRPANSQLVFCRWRLNLAQKCTTFKSRQSSKSSGWRLSISTWNPGLKREVHHCLSRRLFLLVSLLPSCKWPKPITFHEEFRHRSLRFRVKTWLQRSKKTS